MRRLRFEDLGVAAGCADTHVTRLEGGRESEGHTHDFHEVFLVMSGEGIHHLNGRKVALRAGQLVAVRPDDAHWYSTARGQELVFVNVAVSSAWQQAFHTLLGVPDRTRGRRSVTLSAAEARGLGADLGATALTSQPRVVVETWTRVQECFVSAREPARLVPPPWLETLRGRLAENPERLTESIAFWQRLAGRSPEHLARSSRRFYGMTFSELLNRARVDRARYLLRTSDEKVISVAFACGFQNLANFYRVFARQTGRTPSQWRREGTGAVPIFD